MKITFHYTFLLVAISFILTGYFSNLIIFTSIILIHELGHYHAAKINNLKVDKIIIYPYGGITKINTQVNTQIKKELIIAISGIMYQSIYFFLIYILYQNNIIREYIFNIFKIYNQSILLFNILPIHPLDGSKILNLLLSTIIPYKKTLKINIIISIITIIILIITNYYEFNYTTILIISVLLDNIIKYYKDINYYFNKFLLERYLNNYNYKKHKKINKIDNMYKEKNHVIKVKNHYITEKQALIHRFNKKKSKNI